uniref:J domain-containing protein n=1 Tax=viral metagenome TaxID=1070528 RepID=A0A6C0ASV3_9ZZZZ
MNSANRFAALDADEILSTSSANQAVKKAEKKLREITALKKKDEDDLTQEELDKIAMESYWQNIAYPPQQEKNIDESQKAKQKARHLEKLKKQESARAKIEEEKRRKEELRKITREREEKREQERKEREEQEQEQRQRKKEERERKERQEKEKEKEREQGNNKKRKFENMMEESVEYSQVFSEFEEQYTKNHDINKVFKKLSMKYHPDRNYGNESWATMMQQYLADVKEWFENM